MTQYRPRKAKEVAKTRAPTVDDVARLAEVSQAAVSRAFTPGASISDVLRQKVMLAAKQLGYRPNLIARSLTSGKSNVVAVAISRLTNNFHAVLLETLSTQFARLGYRVLLFITDPMTDSDPIMEEIISNRVDAVVLASIRLSSHFAEQCRDAAIPVVMVNRKTESTAVSAIVGDNFHGGRTVASFLLAGRHTRFGFMAGTEHSSTSRDREDGYRSLLRENGFALAARAVGNFNFEQARQAARELLSRPDRPDALFCANDHMALAAIDVARGEFGMAVGRDISIVGFDGSDPAGWSFVGLTTFVQPAERMARLTVQVLQNMMDDPSATPVNQTVGGELLVRSSARLPPSGITEEPGRAIWRLAVRGDK